MLSLDGPALLCLPGTPGASLGFLLGLAGAGKGGESLFPAGSCLEPRSSVQAAWLPWFCPGLRGQGLESAGCCPGPCSSLHTAPSRPVSFLLAPPSTNISIPSPGYRPTCGASWKCWPQVPRMPHTLGGCRLANQGPPRTEGPREGGCRMDVLTVTGTFFPSTSGITHSALGITGKQGHGRQVARLLSG